MGGSAGKVPNNRGADSGARAEKPLQVLFSDDYVLVVNKPAGLASVPSSGSSERTCFSLVQKMHRDVRAAHRLDKDTSGVLLFALHRATADALNRQFKSKEVEKAYLAVVNGVLDRSRGTIEKPIRDMGKAAKVVRGGRPAITRYRVVESFTDATLVEVRPETGRHNQIRLHFASIGHPLVGERKYARGAESSIRFRRLALHASWIAFHHPVRNERIKVKAELPADLQELVERLRRER